MELRDVIGHNIKEVLSHLPEKKLTDLVDFLLKQGVKKEKDLRHMTIPILKEILDTVDSTDLHEEWQKKYGGQVQPISRIPLSTIESNSMRPEPSTSSSSLQAQARQVNSKLPVFEVDSPYLPTGVKTAIKEKKRPKASEREDMVSRIVDRCREVVPNFSRSDLNAVARDIVSKFPASFKDTVPISDHGSDGLARQLKVKFDNDRRPKSSRTSVEKAAPCTPMAFGCTSWNPACPEDQTEATQEDTMKDLQRSYKLSRKDRDWKTIKSQMEETFYLQRKHINWALTDLRKRKRADEQGYAEDTTAVQYSIVDHKENWPFLFTSKGLNLHYQLLTEIDFIEMLKIYVNETASIVIDFLSCKNDSLRKLVRRMHKADRSGHRSTIFPTFLKMLIVNFGEDPKHLMKFVERTILTLDEAQDSFQDFPEDKTPFLAIAGSSIYDYESVFVAIDNQFVAKVNSIQDGFAMAFSAYFVFNIKFPNNMATLLTFSHRVIAGVNITKGTKCGTAAINRKVNDRLVTFTNKLELFQQNTNSEENE